jgi:adiponectin receptor
MINNDLMLVPSRVKKRRMPLRTSEQLPDYLREEYGPFITSHYRGELSFYEALKTFFTLHNESANIHSHSIGCFIMMAILIAVLYNDNTAPKWPFIICIMGSIYLLCVSTFAHLLCCMGRKIYYSVWKFDYTAITVAMWTMYVPWCWYIFDGGYVYYLYITFSGIISVICIFMGTIDKLKEPVYRHLRTFCFCLLGFTGLAPTIHAYIIYYKEYHVLWAIKYNMLQLLCNIIGTVLYSSRIPERWFPGRYNLIGHSHFIMHILVIIAFLMYHRACWLLWSWSSQEHG